MIGADIPSSSSIFSTFSPFYHYPASFPWKHLSNYITAEEGTPYVMSHPPLRSRVEPVMYSPSTMR